MKKATQAPPIGIADLSLQKETPLEEISRSAEREESYAPSTAPHFEERKTRKRIGENFHRRVVRTYHTEYSCLAMTWSWKSLSSSTKYADQPHIRTTSCLYASGFACASFMASRLTALSCS